MRCEARTLDDIRALGGNDLADERRFEAAARLSEINLALYRTFAQPCGQAPWSRRRWPRRCAGCTRCGSPTRCSARATRSSPGSAPRPSGSARTASRSRPDNPLLAAQEQLSQQIVDGLEAWRKAVGEAVRGDLPRRLRRPGAAGGARHRHRPRASRRARRRRACCTRRWSSAASPSSRREMTGGGLREALVRALLYVGMARNAVDERGFEAIRRLRDAHPGAPADDAGRVQGAGPRAVLHAADRRGGGARRRSRRCCPTRSRSAARPSRRCARCSRPAARSATPRRAARLSASPRCSASTPSR